MRYESQKRLVAVMSVTSVAVLIKFAVESTSSMEWFTGYLPWNMVGAIMGSMVAAALAIAMSRRLALARDRRRVFIIYAREDMEAARGLAIELRKHGFIPWLDLDEIRPGQVWQKVVIRALEESSVALVLVSKNLAKSGFVQEELKVALDTLQERDGNLSPVIPVRLDETEVPQRLAHVQWVSLWEEHGMERLLEGLSKIGSSATGTRDFRHD